MRSFLAISLLFALAPLKVHADLVTYNMEGTIQFVGGYSFAPTVKPLPGSSFPVALGDHIAWTVQYDRSTPASTGGLIQSNTNGNATYFPSGPMFSNLVDQTNGYHVYTAPPGSFPASSFTHIQPLSSYSSLALTNSMHTGVVDLYDYQPDNRKGSDYYSIQMHIASQSLLPTLNLANLRLDQIPFLRDNTSAGLPIQFDYTGQIPNTKTVVSFDVQLNSITDASIASLPEPATLPLFALGAIGFALRRFRRVFV